MKKFNTLIFCMLFVVSALFAQPRNVQEAAGLAKQFLQEQSINKGTLLKNATLAQPRLIHTQMSKVKAQPNYFVFQRANNAGYVIISGDVRAEEVLAFSDKGQFDVTNLPPNMVEWLMTYEMEIDALRSNTLRPLAKRSNNFVHFASTVTSVAPLLGNIQWNQGEPYNNICPLDGAGDRTVTGCVATAMAQIMKYYEYPAQGTGSVSYITSEEGLAVNVDFSNSTYDWDNMTDQYDSESTAAENAAVALLMRDCGAAVEMDYTSSASAAFSTDVPYALSTYFGYDADMQSYSKDYYTTEQWEDLFKAELGQNRPIYHSGSSLGGGHAFVCDGFNQEDYFHFNWGWGGYCDGYFKLSALTPETGGIGSGTEDGYNSYKTIITGIKPDDGDANPPYSFGMNFMTTSSPTYSRNDDVYIELDYFLNRSSYAFTGDIVALLTDTAGSIIEKFANSFVSNVDAGSGWYTFSLGGQVPMSVPNGTYRLYAGSISSADTTTVAKVLSRAGKPNYLEVQITSSQISFIEPSGYDVNLSLSNLRASSPLHNNRTGEISFSITNNGVEYMSNFLLEVGSMTVQLPSITILAGETKDFVVREDITLSAGTYTAQVKYDDLNIGNNATTNLGAPVSVTVLAEPTQPSALALESQISYDNNAAVPQKGARLTIEVRNTGGFAVLEPYVNYYDADGSYITWAKMGTILIGTNEVKTLVYESNLTLAPGTYTAIVDYYEEGWKQFTSPNNQCAFTVVAGPQPQKYTLNFDANGGTVNPASKEVTEDEAIGVLPRPARAGHNFVNWKIDDSVINASTVWTYTADQTALAEWVVAPIDTASNDASYDTIFPYFETLSWYNLDRGYMSGHNGYNWSKFAEKASLPHIGDLHGLQVAPMICQNNSGNGYVTFKVWDCGTDGRPGVELASKQVSMDNLPVPDSTNINFAFVEFDAPIENVRNFFYGFEIEYGTPVDTFVMITSNNYNESGNPSTMYVDHGGSWWNIAELLTDFSASLFMGAIVEMDSLAPELGGVWNVDFPLYSVGANACVPVHISNIGNGEMTVEAIYGLESPFSNATLGDMTIASGDTVLLDLFFNPTMPGEFYDTLIIETNGGTKRVPVYGSCRYPYNQIMDGGAETNVLNFDYDLNGWTQHVPDGYGSIAFVADYRNRYINNFIAFAPAETNPAITDFAPHSGDRFIMCFTMQADLLADGDTVNNKWLITPQSATIGTGAKFEAYVRGHSSAYTERYAIHVSTTGTDISDFTKISSGEYLEISGDTWTKIEYDLSAYVGEEVYVAIQYLTNPLEGLMLCLDDVVVDEGTPFVPVPVASVAACSFMSPFTVTLTCADPTAEIFYTLDGTDPRTSVTVIDYTGAISIPASSTTLKAFAMDQDLNFSELLSVNYNYVTQIVPVPVPSVVSSEFSAAFTVTLTCADPTAEMFYTLDGTDPTESVTVIDYVGPISIPEATTTLKAFAMDQELNFSDVLTETYTYVVPAPQMDDVVDFDAFETLADAENNVRITGEMTAVYQNFKSLYVYDGSDFELLYGDYIKDGRLSLVNGQSISNVVGKYALYQGAPQMVVDTIETIGAIGTAIAPTVVLAGDITAEDIHQYVRMENVEIAADVTYTSGIATRGDIVVDAGTMAVYSQFRNIDGSFEAGDKVNFEGFVSVYNNAVQVYITAIEAAPVVEVDATEAAAAIVYVNDKDIVVLAEEGARVQIYTLTGVCIYNAVATDSMTTIGKMPTGAAVVVVDGIATKVVVR